MPVSAADLRTLVPVDQVTAVVGDHEGFAANLGHELCLMGLSLTSRSSSANVRIWCTEMLSVRTRARFKARIGGLGTADRGSRRGASDQYPSGRARFRLFVFCVICSRIVGVASVLSIIEESSTHSSSSGNSGEHDHTIHCLTARYFDRARLIGPLVSAFCRRVRRVRDRASERTSWISS